MKNILLIINFLLLTQSVLAQKSYAYLKNIDEVKGKRIVYTEIDINASPEEVKKIFLEFDQWSKWCKVFPKIEILSGDFNHIESKPKLELTSDFGRKNDPKKFPINPIVSVNNKNVFVWGIHNGILIKAEHVFVFEPKNEGKGTHLIHYETMTGMLSPFLMTNKVKANMEERYTIMNKDLKNFCEKKINSNEK